MIVSMKTMMRGAEKDGYAIGAFNIFNYLTAKAVVDTCQDMASPVILQMSVKTVRQLGLGPATRAILDLAAAATVPATVHLDHCKDLDFALACVDFGFPSVMVDGSAGSLDENIAMTRTAREYAAPKGCVVEGELGAIVGVEEDVVVAAGDGSLADVASSIRFVQETGVDVFAPAIGTAHGVYKGEPRVDFDRFTEIKAAVGAPLVVHGGTGLAPDVFRKLIGLGASKINISTAVKLAYLGTIGTFMRDNPNVGEPLALDAAITAAVGQTTREHIELFGSAGKAAVKGEPA